ncbi:MAG: glycerol-3-phosphate dehydrogenase [Gammaproteobacteria bacterium]|jgi:glycerol-3-phosphate dehydrogenase
MKTTSLSNSAKTSVAIIGGGINGLCSAWLCAQQGMKVSLFEKETLMSQTSRCSSKLLHGGLRYLEYLQFSLVQESLRERKFWMDKVPELTNDVELIIPIYKKGIHNRWKYKLGLIFYDFLAGKNNLGKHRYLTKDEVVKIFPSIKEQGLTGAYGYHDGQMDDYELGLWVSKQLLSLGGTIRENTKVGSVTNQGEVKLVSGESIQFDCVVNACGPWAQELVTQSDINCDIKLKLVRGTHIIIPKISDKALYLEDKESKRLFFVLPYKGKMLVGTTEEVQDLARKIEPTKSEIDYLINAFNEYFVKTPISHNDIIESFAGARPLILESSKLMNEVSREYKIKCEHKLINVFGGKWTTSRKLGESVLIQVLKAIDK